VNGMSCSHCGQLNPELQKTCERCGQSLLWAPVRSKRTPHQGLLKVLGYSALGIALGLGAAHFQKGKAPVLVAGQTAPRIDVVFAIDATGSMSDEIEVVKSKVSKMMDDIQAGSPKPEVRIGLVAYRDHGDAYVTKAYPLTSAIAGVQGALQQIDAAGGGDTPEAVAEGLSCAVNEINWDQDPNTTRMIFLIGDAGGHPNDNYRESLKLARAKGIKVNTWGCSGLQDFGQSDFEEIAALGGGEFQFLTYQQEVRRQDGTRARLIYQGSKSYEVKQEVDWTRGADRVKEKVVVDSGAVEAPGASGAAVYKSERYAPVTSEVENNLDTVLVRQVQDEASKKGIKY